MGLVDKDKVLFVFKKYEYTLKDIFLSRCMHPEKVCAFL